MSSFFATGEFAGESAGAYLVEPPPWHAENWDEGSFESVTVPGLMHVEVDRGPKWDRKAVKGQTGETQTFGGWNNASLKIRVRTWTAAQHEAMLANVIPVIEPTPGKDAPKQLAFDHPVARARKVDVILIEKIKGPTVDDDGKFSEWEIDAFQSIKKVPQQGGTGKPGQTPCQQCKALLDQKAAEFIQAQVNLGNGTGTVEDLQVRQAAMDNQAQVCTENGCNEQNMGPGANAQGGGGGVPPP